MHQKLKVMIADDHALMRKGLGFMLKDVDEIEVVAEAIDGKDLIEKLAHFEPDIILLDVEMPFLSGIEAAKKIGEDFPYVKIIFFSGHITPEYLLQCFRAGCYAYLPKTAEPEEIKLVVKKAVKGEKYIHPIIEAQYLEAIEAERHLLKSRIKVNPREKEILVCLSDGLSTKEIADKLFISMRTVDTHRFNLLKRFGLKNAIELVNKAKEQGII